MLFLCYSGCSTCRKAKQFLEEHGCAFESRNIKTENPTFEELSGSMKQTELVRANVLGFVLNEIDYSHSSHYSYHR